jgi:hypothetical protein
MCQSIARRHRHKLHVVETPSPYAMRLAVLFTSLLASMALTEGLPLSNIIEPPSLSPEMKVSNSRLRSLELL